MATRPFDPEPEDLSAFTNQPSEEPWVLTPAVAEAVIESWEKPRQPSRALRTAYEQYLETIGQK